MLDNQVACTGKSSQHKDSVSLYVDNQNVCLNEQEANWILDFTKSKGCWNCTRTYYNSLCKNQADLKNNLSALKLSWIDVPCSLKNSADNQLISDCLDDLDKGLLGDIVIIVSGDGDFAKLVRLLKKLGRKVIILAKRGNVKQMLTELADKFHFIDELPQPPASQVELNTDGVLSTISYEDAIECLNAAIKTAMSQNKKTGFRLISNLMCDDKQFPNYTGSASIRQADGKNFSRFRKFINAVVKDGKIFVENNEIFLAEECKMAA
ncbi:MAG TPA: NYN domain-containing protein [Oculatellaceae cyanobacterium]